MAKWLDNLASNGVRGRSPWLSKQGLMTVWTSFAYLFPGSILDLISAASGHTLESRQSVALTKLSFLESL